MKDVTTLVIEAQDARSRMQEAKKRVKAEVRRKYEARMNLEIAEASQDAEIEFARTLARVHESGVSQAVLRREVLRTNVWSVWTYWRDLANIEPERVTVANAREERERINRVFEWIDGVLHVYKNTHADKVLPHTLVIPYYSKRSAWTGMATSLISNFGKDVMDTLGDFAVHSDYLRFESTIHKEIARAFEAGEITEETKPDPDGTDPRFMEIINEHTENLYRLNPWVEKKERKNA